MKIEDVRHRATIDCIKKYNIDIEPFDNIDLLRKHLRSVKCKDYRLKNKEYFRKYMYDYMYDRYGMKKNLEWISELPNV
jgi:hypothetical protein